VPIPKTFSAPADVAFPALNGYVPSKEDSLRYALWLMLVSDDVNRDAHSNVRGNPDAGVNITQVRPEYDATTLAIKRLPCQFVDVKLPAGRWSYSTSHAGELQIVMGIVLLEAANTSALTTDAAAPPLTMEAKLERVRRILMRGTLYKAGMTTGDGKVLDPYRTPLNEDGTYNMSAAKWISVQAPDLKPAASVRFANRRVRSESELLALDPVRDFAVSSGWLATYTVNVSDRDATE